MFLVYTLTSVGLIWLELSTVGLFLDEYGADNEIDEEYARAPRSGASSC